MDLYEELKKLMKNNMLIPEQKITLCYKQKFGGLTACQTRFYHCEKVPAYKNCPEDKYIIKIYHIPAGKKKIRICNITCQSCLVIFNNYIDIDEDEINYNVTYKNGHRILESKYALFSDEIFKDLVRAYPNYMLCKL